MRMFTLYYIISIFVLWANKLVCDFCVFMCFCLFLSVCLSVFDLWASLPEIKWFDFIWFDLITCVCNVILGGWQQASSSALDGRWERNAGLVYDPQWHLVIRSSTLGNILIRKATALRTQQRRGTLLRDAREKRTYETVQTDKGSERVCTSVPQPTHQPPCQRTDTTLEGYATAQI